MEVLFSRALIYSYKTRDKLVLVNNVSTKYDYMKT